MLYLPEKQDQILITSSRPFGTETVFAKAPEGLSIAQLLWNRPPPKNLPISVECWVDGKSIPCELWESTYPKKGQLVAFKAYPTGSALRTIFQVLVMIVAVAAAVLLQQYELIPGVLSWGTVAGIGISVVGNLLINAFIPVKTPKQSDFNTTNDAPTQWISGAQNTINQWGSVPVLLGTHRTTPFYGAKPYTEIVGNDQYLRCLFVIGYGPLQLSDFKLGDADINTFRDVQMEVRSGYEDDEEITLIPNQVDELGLQILLNYGEWNSRTTEEEVDEFSIDWSFPSGLVIIDQQAGIKRESTVTLQARYRKVGEEDWIDIADDLPVPTMNRTLQSAWDGGWYYDYNNTSGASQPQNRIDYVCIRKDTGVIRVFQSALGTSGSIPFPPQIDTVNYHKLADVRIYGDTIKSITDIRDLGYITGCAVTLVSGLTVNIAEGSVLNLDRLKTTAASTTAVRRTLTIIPPERGQYEVEVRRITADATTINITDKVYWIVLRSIKNEHPINFPFPLTLVALRIKATDQLAGVIDNFNCIATSIVKDYDGGRDNSLLHFDGEDASTDIVDEFGNEWTAEGNAKLATADKVFGSASLELDGDGDYVHNTTITSLGSKFTIEGWFHIDNVDTDNQVIFSAVHSLEGVGYGLLLIYDSDTNTFSLSISSDSLSWDIADEVAGSKNDWENDTWYKWIIEFDGSNYQVYFGEAGGLMILDIDVEDSTPVYSPLVELAIGKWGANYLDGGIDEFRFAPDRCRYGGAIVPETEEFETWVMKPTNNPASLYRYVLQGVPNTKPQTDEKLNLPWFEDFWQWCVDQKFTYNAVTSSAKGVLEQCTEVCSVARCSPQRIEGQWAGVIDREQTVITGHYTPHNSWNLEFNGAFPQLPHGIRVAFIDETNGYQQQERIVYDDGYNEENATLFESVSQQGVTNPALIYKLWRYNIACLKLRAFPFSFMVDWEHLTNTRGDLIRVGFYELSGQLFSGRIKDVEEVGDSHILTLDNTIIMENGRSYAIRIRQQDGTTLTGNVITEEGETNVITTDGALIHEPNIGDLFQFGEYQAESIPAIIKTIEPTDKLCAKVTCLDYHPGIFYADIEDIPEWNPIVTRPYLIDERPSIPEITGVISDESVIQRDPGGRFKFRIAVNFRFTSSTKINAQYVQAQYSLNTESEEDVWETIPAVSILAGILFIPDVQEGEQYQIRIRALTNTGISSEWSSPYLETVVGRTSAPENITNFDYSFTNNGILLNWDRLTTIDINYYELRYGGTGWEDAALIAKINSNSYEWQQGNQGNYTIRIKAIDFLGMESAEDTTLLVSIIPPYKPTDLRSQVIHNQVLLYWECLQGSFPISCYKVYKGEELIGTVGGNFISFYENEAEIYIYTILAIDFASNESQSASISVRVNDPFGFVLGYEQGLTISGGEFTHAIYDPETQRIYMPVDIASSYDDFMDDWGSWQAKIDAGYPYWLQPSLESGEWLSDTIDLGEIISSSKIEVNLLETVLVPGCTVKVYIQYSPDEVDWTEIEGTLIIASNFRYFRVRVIAEQEGNVGLISFN
jgi:hypothetical protein